MAMTVLFENLDEEQARTYALVLAVEEIKCELAPGATGWELRVALEDRAHARSAVDAYLVENRAVEKSAAGRYRLQRSYTGLWAALLLLTTHLVFTAAGDEHWVVARFGASARDILNGQYYRCATALMLHVDSVHLAGNMAGIALFGTAVCTVAGWGVGWLIILAGGTLGNLLNAMFYQTDHLSIGASTAVFAGLGFLAGWQFLKKYREPGRRIRAWLPLGGGLALLAMLGGSPYVDLTAHLFGFTVGLLIGLPYMLLAGRPFDNRVQSACFFIAVAILTLSWWAGAR